MSLFETLLINTIFILFPLLLCLMYQTYNRVYDRDKNNLFLDCALCTSFYFIVRFGITDYSFLPSLLLNVPLMVAYMKRRMISIVFLSICSIIYFHQILLVPFWILIIEYLVYLALMFLNKKEYLRENVFFNSLILTKIFFFCLNNYLFSLFTINNWDQLLMSYFILFSFYVITQFMWYLFLRTEEVMALHQTIRDFEEEKQIRSSLFKITHEIKNPIAVCKGYLDMFDVNNVEHSRKYVPILKDEIARILILLQDFLSITKIKIEKDIVDFNVLVEDTIHSFDILLKEKNIICNKDIADEEWYFMADYNRLSQVLINMIKNSIEAIPEDRDGKISIKTSIKKNHLCVTIEDNGCGISKENLRKMKEPFFTTKEKGTGLGVYLSSEIMKAHGGLMRYSSKEGVGTTVVLSFQYEKIL